VDCRVSQETGHDHTDCTPNAVAGEYIERIFERSFRFPVNDHIADQTGERSDEETGWYGYESCGGSDGDEAYDSADAKAQCRWFLSADRIEEYPRETSCGRSSIRCGEGRSSKRTCA